MTDLKTIYNHAALSTNWHNQRILPDDLVVMRQTVSGHIPCHNPHAAEFLYVERGQGTLKVNGKEYQLAENRGVFLFTHHFHEMTVPAGETLDIVSCQFSFRTYVYLTALLPYPEVLPHNHSSCDFVCFPPAEQAHITRIIEALLIGNTQKKSPRYIPLLLEWIARFYRRLNDD